MTSFPDASTGGAGGVIVVPPDSGPADSGLINPSLCGNGKLDLDEECDDGNKTNRDGCNNNCHYTCTPERPEPCSDGDFCNGIETCDDMHQCHPATAKAPDGAVCGDANKCQGGVCLPAAPDCGDGLIERPEEECEDGNSVNGDGCDNCRFTCLSTDKSRDCNDPDPCPGVATCNDTMHTCKPGTPLTELSSCGNGKACVNKACTDKYCGNGKPDEGEECDDGNQFDGDGCNHDCRYSCVASDKTRDCHSDNVCIASGTCDSTTHKCSPLLPKTAGTACPGGKNCVAGNCIAPVCGDGIPASGIEACDDGNALNTDSCTSQCKPVCSANSDCASRTPLCRSPSCGSGACSSTPDTGKNGTDCTTAGGTAKCNNGACTAGTCGDGTVDAGEQCDDQNSTNGDGCDNNCLYSCSTAADCDDKNDCTGTETCAVGGTGKKCVSASPKADGETCATGKICVAGLCRASFCGDGYTDATKGESCDPPNTVGCDSTCKRLATCALTGNWAMKVTVGVTWSSSILLDGMGDIVQHALVVITQPPGNTAFEAKIKPCGLSIPDFQTTSDLNSERYGIAFPVAEFDSPNVPTFTVNGRVSNLAPGAKFEVDSAALLLGVKADNAQIAFGKWPDSWNQLTPANGFTLQDIDNDGKLGLTAVVKTGEVPGTTAMYSDIIYDLGPAPVLSNPGRANRLYLAVRQIASESGTVTSCTEVSGTSTAKIENHIVGCQADDNNPSTNCTPDLVDAVRPLYNVGASTFIARQIGSQASCDAVRAAVP
jgi:cysteine-rich repeat protein